MMMMMRSVVGFGYIDAAGDVRSRVMSVLVVVLVMTMTSRR